MLNPDRLGAQVNNWALLLIALFSFLLYQLLPAPLFVIAMKQSSAWVLPGTLVGVGLGIVLPLWLVTRRLAIPFRSQFQIAMPQPRLALIVVAATVSLIPALDIITDLMARRFPPESLYFVQLELFRGRGPWSMAAVATGVAVLVPIGEELLFRGLIQRVLLRNAPPVRAVVLVGLLFGAVHMMVFTFPGIAILGIFFGFLVLASGNLVYAIIAHGVWNLFNIAALNLMPTPEPDQFTSPFASQSLLWFFMSLTLFSFFCRLIARQLRRETDFTP